MAITSPNPESQHSEALAAAPSHVSPAVAGSASAGSGALSTGTTATRLIGLAAIAASALLALLGLIASPEDVDLGSTVRILYVHVGTVWVAYLAFVVTAIASGAYLWKRTRSLTWDRIAGASAEAGVAFMAVTLIAGSLWGRLTWGTYWVWEARVTTTAFLFVTYLGYLAVRNLGGSHHQRARRSAVLALLAVLEIPLVHFSVRLWEGVHQDASVADLNGDVTMDGLMLFTLLVGVVAFTLVFMWFVLHRQRVLHMRDALDDRGLDRALAERLREGA
jgi:heme exporter protein C